MVKRWDELEPAFKRLVFRDGVSRTAERVPIHRSTAYRILNGEIKRPCQAIRKGVEKVLDEEKKTDE